MRTRFLVVLCFLVLFQLSGCATAPKRNAKQPTGLTYLSDVCRNNGIECQRNHLTHVVTMRKDGAHLKTFTGAKTAIIENKVVQLQNPLSPELSQIALEDASIEELLDNLMKQVETMGNFDVRMLKKIVVDAGHGGKDPGAIGISGVYEKDIVLDIAKKLKLILEHNGVEVVMTRDHDEFISLQRRSEIASESGADFFVSIHANANKVRHIKGFEAYTLRRLDAHEMNEDVRTENLVRQLDSFRLDESSGEIRRILDDMLYAHKLKSSDNLAVDFGLGCHARNTAKEQRDEAVAVFCFKKHNNSGCSSRGGVFDEPARRNSC